MGDIQMIQLPIRVLDEKCCTGCQAMELEKTEYYANADTAFTEYYCKNLHLCQYIRNRIIRNIQDKNNKGEQENGE